MKNLKKFAFLFFAICGLISFVACEENNVEDVYTIQVGEMSDAYSDNIILQAKVAVELAPYIADTQVRTGKDDKAADGASLVSYTPGAKKALFAKGRDLYICDFPAPRVAMKEKVTFKNLVAPVDYTAEWAQVYDEVWRAFRDGFYLETMHGIDWKAIKKK